MNREDKVLISQQEMDQIHKAFSVAEEAASNEPSRKERHMESIYYGDTPTFMELPLARKPQELEGADAVIMGFPYEGITALSPTRSAPPTVSRPPKDSIYWRMGSDLAPEWIRKYSIYYSIHHNRGYFPEIADDLVIMDHIRVVDYGDVKVLPEDAEETIRRAKEMAADIVKAGAVPIVFGGDHTTPTPILQAILERAERKIGLISFDAHLDFANEPLNWASSMWAQTLELGKISPRNFIEIGIRGVRNSIFDKNVSEHLGHRVYNIDEVKDRGMKDVIEEALELACDGTDGLYVSIDLDVMDPSSMIAQKAPEFWGLTTDEFFMAIRKISRKKVVGLDICELTPDYDVNGMGAQFCARAAAEFLGGLALRKREEKA